MAFILATADEILRTLGQRIRAQRLAQGLPQSELAQMAGLSLGALRKLEKYSPAALTQGLELSPLHLKLRPAAYGEFPAHSDHLPGLIANSLPDGWGLLLMDRLFRRQGLRHPGPLDRLAFIGDRAIGALRFVPAVEPDASQPDWSLPELARESARALAGEAGAALRELALTGGVPQGAR